MKKDKKIRIAKAFHAMKQIGIKDDKVKPALKKLLLLHEKKWELIEAENYRVLADTIFEMEETAAAELSKKIVNNGLEDEMEEEAPATGEMERTLKRSQATEEMERPLKRSRHINRDGQSSSHTDATKAPLEEPEELPEARPLKLKGSQGMAESPLANSKNTRAKSQAKSLVQEYDDPCQANGTSRNHQNTPLGTEPTSTSHRMRLRDKGKGSVDSQVSSKKRTPVLGSSSPAGRLKEPNVGPGIFLSPKQKSCATPLIKPKDEPITDGISLTLDGGDSLSRDERGHYGPEASIPKSLREKTTANGTDYLNEPNNNGKATLNPDECSSDLLIASSPSGEVKISLTYDLALVRSDFHMPNLDAVLKMVEDKWLSKYDSLNRNFSVVNLMKHMCQCFLKIGTESNSKFPGTTGVDPPHSNGIDDSSQPDKMAAEDDSGIDKEKEKVCAVNDSGKNKEKQVVFAEHTVVDEQLQEAPILIRSLRDVVDIAKGQENVVITLVNEVNDELPPYFHYIPQNAFFQNAYVNFSLARIGDNNTCFTCSGDCLLLDTPCACSYESGGEFAYTIDGLVKEELLKECVSMNRHPDKHCQFFCKECPLERSKGEDIIEPCKGHLVRKFIKECWWKCGCPKQCGNRVVQRGISHKLQVFMTPGGKGWGLRTLEDLPKGAFVCEYVGEVLTNTELFDRVLRSPIGEKHSYPVLLDADWCAEGVLKDEEALCLDATYYGNVARFINHRCFDSNMVEIPVEVETPDHHYYHLAFFTTRKVKAMEELTWDYGIDFDDHDHPIKAFRCQCGSKFCRMIKRRSRPARRW